MPQPEEDRATQPQEGTHVPQPQQVGPGRRAGGVGCLVAAGGLAGLAPGTASASSHREAPAIAGQPQYDNTDVHAFVSPDRAGAVTLVGNWIPLPAIGIGTLLALAGGLARRRGLPPLPVTG